MLPKYNMLEEGEEYENDDARGNEVADVNLCRGAKSREPAGTGQKMIGSANSRLPDSLSTWQRVYAPHGRCWCGPIVRRPSVRTSPKRQCFDLIFFPRPRGSFTTFGSLSLSLTHTHGPSFFFFLKINQ